MRNVKVCPICKQLLENAQFVLFTEDKVITTLKTPNMTGEDFSNYLKLVPGSAAFAAICINYLSN